ncbi:hypothetical protein EJ02DRAFT_504376 [Clathrospora elynae]|uniref:BTB domain-containing protein n=1 Tax=Clathrospora elynae TaxID=706981 RepID=A0A6A5SND2_9PLEO|nr:hypothetical protein EJ02DRAFT_504376 [Clathrospora elynae]
MAETAREELINSLKSLLSSSEYSDFTITCGADAYKVHKAIVCSRSGFLKRAEKFPFGKKSAENMVNLPADDPAIIKCLFHFLYGCDSNDAPIDRLLHAKMYEITDKYNLRGLKMPTREKFTLEHAFMSTPDEDQGLREILYEIVVSHVVLLEQTSVEELMGSHTGFAFSVIKRQAAELARLKSS